MRMVDASARGRRVRFALQRRLSTVEAYDGKTDASDGEAADACRVPVP